ncbi:MAG: YihY/virulence factor BrkB family protein [Candidatus Eremiobacteraeota bacterium]|nr:YihY/virulence factor BrkB family protein [Candidatus Eremiobacteraeota bacterium]
MQARQIVWLLKETYRNWSDDNASRMAAALAYYAAFALAPLMIVVIEIGALLLGGNGHHHVVRDAMLQYLRPSLGDAGTKAVGDLVQATFNQRNHGLFATIVGYAIFIAAATGLFIAIEGMLDAVWHVDARTTGIAATLRARAKTLALIAGIAVVLLLSLLANAGLSALSGALAAASPVGHAAASVATPLLSFFVVSVGFAALFKYLPKTAVAWKDVVVGAAMTGALFIIGQYLIGLYLGRISTGSTFGAAGTFVAILLWLYYSGQIFLFGAEFTKVFATSQGSKSKRSA